MDDLVAHETIVYEMNMDTKTGSWDICLMQNLDRDMIGLAEFTQ